MSIDLATACRRAQFGKMMPPSLAPPSIVVKAPPVKPPPAVILAPEPRPVLVLYVCSVCGEVQSPAPTIRKIQGIVERIYNVSHADMMSSRRTPHIVRCRQLGMYLARTMTSHSMPEIGRYFGGKDHTTVMHACRKFEHLVSVDEKVRAEVEALKAAIA